MTVRDIGECAINWLDNYEEFAKRGLLAQRVERAEGLGARFDAIKAFYDHVNGRINSAPAHRWAMSPYVIDWTKLFSPIEYMLWCEIRNAGAILYPQYPIGRYFADFANPVARVVIECDGKDFHTDWRADEERQAILERRGWTVYRITGSACMSPDRNELDEDGNEIGTTSKALQFVENIARQHPIAARFMARDHVEEEWS